jgi:hypothetical protein
MELYNYKAIKNQKPSRIQQSQFWTWATSLTWTHLSPIDNQLGSRRPRLQALSYGHMADIEDCLFLTVSFLLPFFFTVVMTVSFLRSFLLLSGIVVTYCLWPWIYQQSVPSCLVTRHNRRSCLTTALHGVEWSSSSPGEEPTLPIG